jgi:membrane-associated phospholipid phosphatase
VYGAVKHDRRAIGTANDLVEALLTMGIATQILKRISGRESPFKATKSGGNWSPFPSFSSYQHNTSSYDAFPSGHLATLMATITVLQADYPGKKWIRPVGYTLMGLTAWAMMNTEVHWASDYPLAVAVGYVAGRVTTRRHKVKKTPAPILF